MAILKCKMCGGDLNITADEKIIECEFCGTTQTIPDGRDEKKTNLFNRANRLRIANEFDKAAGIYESIIAEFPEEAEAYWGLCLCKFGIEYVDDPKTAKKIPTCHRTSFESIFDDENYKMALEKSDVIAQGVYKEEAIVIDNLQKDILSIVHKEEPFDVFICYKETDELGQRTQDSVFAQDIYEALTVKGFKVFFSRITLEDKLGKQYEPYIFAALNSAKVMLAIGTKEEYYNAVWVKNEWSRYLALMESDKSKMLIPCYRDIDPYDMPQEFKNLQGQDMSKLGFLQDLVRGVSKIVAPEPNKPVNSETAPTTSANATVDSLLKRAFMFLEDGNWKSAEEYCEKVLDINPECGDAYLGKMMKGLGVRKKEDLLTYNKLSRLKMYFSSRLEEFGEPEFVDKLRAHIKALEDEEIRQKQQKEREWQLKQQQEEEQRIKEEMEYAENLRREKEEAERHAKLLKEYQEKFPVSLKKEESEEKINQAKAKLAETARKYGSKKLAKFVYIPGMIMFGIFCLISLCGSYAFIFNEESIEGGVGMLFASLFFGGFTYMYYIMNKKRIKATDEAENNLNKYEKILDEINSLPTLEEWNNDKAGTEKLAFARREQMEKQDEEERIRKEKEQVKKEKKKKIVIIIACVIITAIISFLIGSRIYRGYQNMFVSVSAGREHTIGIKRNGEIADIGFALLGEEWKDIVSVSSNWKNVVALKKDGTVLVSGEDYYINKSDVENWKNIIQVGAGNYHAVGLKTDGTVVACGSSESGECDTANWTDIAQISAGDYHTVGLKKDGTVVACGNNQFGQCNVGNWEDIVQISAGCEGTFGIKEDGTVVVAGEEDIRQEIESWTDIVKVTGGAGFVAGLKKDGTVVVAGGRVEKDDVLEWKNIVDIHAGSYHLAGVKENGTIVAVGKNDHGQCDVDKINKGH